MPFDDEVDVAGTTTSDVEQRDEDGEEMRFGNGDESQVLRVSFTVFFDGGKYWPP